MSLPAEKGSQTRLEISSSALLGELFEVWGSLEEDRDGSLKVS